MSYSFNVKAATKALALEAVVAGLADVVKSQPVHAKDALQAASAAAAFIGLLEDAPNKDITVYVSGSIYATDAGILNASVSISAAPADRQT